MIYKNPVIRGFNPDPSVCRAGSDYYLVTSSFEYFPGIPIYHSTDLVNWELHSHCITEPGKLDYGRFGDSGGIWAPTIRYYNGRFYVTVTIDGIGNVITWTDDIRGEWSELFPVNMGGIDPSLYFEKDRAFYCTNENSGNGEAVTLCEINPDTGRLIGEKREIWHGTGGGWLEAPHIYKVDGWYYVFTAEGGTFHNHMTTAGRSRQLFGPYESCPFNPILTGRHDTSKQIQCAGHAELIDDAQGNWYLIHLGTRPCDNRKSNLGRETFLTPVRYHGGWFIADGGKAKIENEIRGEQVQRAYAGFKASLDSEDFEKEWIFLNYRQIAKENGYLVLAPLGITFTLAGIRQPDFVCSVNAVFEFHPANDGDEAGLAVYLQSDFHYRIGMAREDGKNYITVRKQAGDFIQTVYRKKTGVEKIHVRIRADLDLYYFDYALGQDALEEAGRASTRFLCVEVPGRCFTGTVLGAYVRGTAKVRFQNFQVEP